jgi:hypothetical protein
MKNKKHNRTNPWNDIFNNFNNNVLAFASWGKYKIVNIQKKLKLQNSIMTCNQMLMISGKLEEAHKKKFIIYLLH